MTGRLVQHIDLGSYATDIVRLSNGDFVVVGVEVDQFSRKDGFIAKYTSTGELVTSFGEGGVTLFDYTEEGHGDDWITTVAALPDGRMLVAGYSVPNGVNNYGMSLALFNENGFLDTSFSDTGLLTYYGGAANYLIKDALVQADGKILVAGHIKENRNLPGDYSGFIARLLPDGSLDATFSGDGIVVDPMMMGVAGLAIQPDGKIVIAGSSQFSFVVSRYLENGSLDSAFGTGGTARQTFETKSSGGGVGAADIALQADGKIVVVGSVLSGPTTDFTVVRFNSNGRIDTTFSGDGIARADFGATNDDAAAVVIDSQGRIVVSGHAILPSENYYGDPNFFIQGNVDFALARFDTSGNLDTTFSGDGKLLVDFGSHRDAIYGAVEASSGAILAVGESFHRTSDPTTGGHFDAAIAAITSAGVLDLSFARSDRVAPTPITFSPAAGATGVALAADLVINFSEPIMRGNGVLLLKSGGAVVASYDVATSSRIQTTESTLRLNPVSDLLSDTTYTVEVPAGAFLDLAGNPTGASYQYSFTTLRQQIIGTSANDLFTGGLRGDYIGGTGTDTIAYTTQVNITPRVAGGYAVGPDTIHSVERVKFLTGGVALDLGPNEAAGNTVKVIGAAFGPSAVSLRPDYVGIGLNLFDRGATMLDVAALVLETPAFSALAGSGRNEDVVATVFGNVVGRAPSPAELNAYVALLQGNGGVMSQAELFVLAANSEANAFKIDLVGLQDSGVPFF